MIEPARRRRAKVALTVDRSHLRPTGPLVARNANEG